MFTINIRGKVMFKFVGNTQKKHDKSSRRTHRNTNRYPDTHRGYYKVSPELKMVASYPFIKKREKKLGKEY